MGYTDCQINKKKKKIDHAAPTAVRCEPASGTPKMFLGPSSGNLPICTGFVVVVSVCEIME